jgi:excisionase family DNA binding protein
MNDASQPTNKPRIPRRRLVTINEVRQVVPLPRSSIYQAVRDRRMPGAVRIGRRVLFDLDVIEAWISTGGGGIE